MKIVYICHPLTEDIKKNTEKIIAILKKIEKTHPDITPVAPYLTKILISGENEAVNNFNHYVYFKRGFVDRLWVYGDSITPNMKTEIEWAIKHRINVEYLSEKMQTQTQKSEDEFLNHIASIVCKELHVKLKCLKTDSRKRKIALCRQMFVTIAYRNAFIKTGRNINLKTIGNYVNRHHSTIIHSINTIDDLCFTDKVIKQSYQKIINKI